MSKSPDTKLGRSAERRILLLLGLGCGLLIAGGLAFPIVSGERRAGLGRQAVAEAQIVEIRDHRGVTLLSGAFRSRVDALGNTEKDAPLTDRRGRSVIGEVELEIPAQGRPDRVPELELDILGLPAGQTLEVVIDDRLVGSFHTDDRGSVDQQLREGEVPFP